MPTRTGDEHDDEPEDVTGPDDDLTLCTMSYDHLDSLTAFSIDCLVPCVFETILMMLQNDTDTLAENYSGRFKAYSEAVVEFALPTIHEYYYIDNGKDYFKCVGAKVQRFCPTCQHSHGDLASGIRWYYCVHDKDDNYF
ncbi:hypothetical protein BJX63DRAFT_430160 [Aspergillus granulosus]|uniref:Uncharacterized protein n=1 Tax=Aspergillus granulosus TaxID=176169 RepID=A0ABR4HM19_9EURO